MIEVDYSNNRVELNVLLGALRILQEKYKRKKRFAIPLKEVGIPAWEYRDYLEALCPKINEKYQQLVGQAAVMGYVFVIDNGKPITAREIENCESIIFLSFEKTRLFVTESGLEFLASK